MQRAWGRASQPVRTHPGAELSRDPGGKSQQWGFGSPGDYRVHFGLYGAEAPVRYLSRRADRGCVGGGTRTHAAARRNPTAPCYASTRHRRPPGCDPHACKTSSQANRGDRKWMRGGQGYGAGLGSDGDTSVLK